MNSLRDIKLRLRSVKKIQQITRAMKMVSAVKFRKAQAQLLDSRPYAARLREIVVNAMCQCDPIDLRHPLLLSRPIRRMLLVVVSSDRGLCGGFNTNVFRRVQRYMHEFGHKHDGTGKEIGLYLIGRKANDYFKRFSSTAIDFHIHQAVPFAEAAFGVVGKQLHDLYVGGEFDQIDLFFTEFKSLMVQRPAHARFLPVEAFQPAEIAQRKRALEYLPEPDMRSVLNALIPAFVNAQIARVLLESQASEHGARMSMMDQATKNGDELIDELQLYYNKARQLSITRELADITTGAEAMK